ncbi:hypothetical protein [Streptomyces sp. NBC_01314]|uniref:hypothetical protein n=1 Tax=Streptomyces sp. NBC_01314 TaxID=2903821 RepID=UPI003090F217|nr:hypothetical protein OG622_00580 [Streptomyces sp. NBC_01314]
MVRSSSGRTRPANGQPAVADVEAVEHESADLGDSGGVHCGEGEDESCRWSGGCRDGAVDLGGDERLQHTVLVLPDLDPAGRVAEDEACPLGPGEQRAQGDELISAMVALQHLEMGEDVLVSHLPRCQ